jgi:hypothetical protein
MMATLVYLACALTSALCAGLLVRSWLRNRVRLLLWSALCFIGLTINNVLLLVDEKVVPDVDLQLFRDVSSLAAVSVLLFGLIWESR